MSNNALWTGRCIAAAVAGAAVALIGHDLTESWKDFGPVDYMLGGIWLTVATGTWLGIEMLGRHSRRMRARMQELHDEMLAAMLAAQPTSEAVAGHICRQMADGRPDAKVVNLRD